MCTLRTIYDTIAYRKKMDTAIRVSGGQESRLYFMKENNCKMTELPADELPYEKCINKGAEVLSDAELLAVILRTGSKGINALELSRKILDAGAPRNGLLGLYHMTIPQLCQIRGIGEVKAVQLKCIAELSRRIAGQSAWSALNFKDAASIADYFMEEMRHLEQEQMILLMLDTKCRLLARQSISKGSVNCSVITPREIFCWPCSIMRFLLYFCTIIQVEIRLRVKRTKALQKGFHLAVSWSGYVFWIILLWEIGVMPVSGK